MTREYTVQPRETDTLKVLRELSEGRAADVREALKIRDRAAEAGKAAPDPRTLLASLEKKRQLLNMIDGYTDKADIATMKDRLNVAINDLEAIISVTVEK